MGNSLKKWPGLATARCVDSPTVIMRLSCEVEVTYTLAQASGAGSMSKGTRSRASVSIGRKSSCKGGKEEELYMLVSTVKNVTGTSYKVPGDVLHGVK